MNADQIKKWRVAHPDLTASDEALAGMPDCASLYANDFIAALEARGNDAVPFLRALLREIVWTYGNWQKAQRDGKPELFAADILNAARGGPDYEFTRKFIADYMRANNIPDVTKKADGSPDFDAMLAGFDTASEVKPK